MSSKATGRYHPEWCWVLARGGAGWGREGERSVLRECVVGRGIWSVTTAAPTHIAHIGQARRVEDVLGDKRVVDIDELVIGLVSMQQLPVEDVRFTVIS